MLSKIRPATKDSLPGRIIWYRYAAVAASILILACLFLFYPVKERDHAVGNTNLTRSQPKGNIKPGTNKAILLLADGSQIELDNSTDDSLAKQGNAMIIKADGKLIYQLEGKTNKENLVNTITTPKGGQFHVVLSDGTNVWLNAASAIKFPASFTGTERIVELKGEAYFEVAKNKQLPFKVQVNGMEVAVLGTHFNVKAYDDENEVKTTLLEGSVKLKLNNKEILMVPGQQARTTDKDHFDVIPNVNLEQVVAWKNGLFEFNDNIRDIMRQISRWYDVDIEYAGNVTEKAFGGAIARNKNISEVLNLLELTGSIHFTVEGKKIMVIP
jgi:ferric-dicitrate binding protein FerR (iron transport regulator)